MYAGCQQNSITSARSRLSHVCSCRRHLSQVGFGQELFINAALVTLARKSVILYGASVRFCDHDMIYFCGACLTNDANRKVRCRALDHQGKMCVTAGLLQANEAMPPHLIRTIGSVRYQ